MNAHRASGGKIGPISAVEPRLFMQNDRKSIEAAYRTFSQKGGGARVKGTGTKYPDVPNS